MAERLQKLLSRAGYGSRRASEQLIRAGRVTVNGRVARLGQSADPAIDRVAVDGQPLSFEELLYIMLNKPRGVLSSTEDELQQGRSTVLDLVPFHEHIYPVGRLDKTSGGLILLTNDGALANRLTHPRYEHEKVYEVTVEGHPDDATLQQWREGLMLRGKRTLPAKVDLLQQNELTTRLRVTLREGRKRQIRRVAELLGHPVRRLTRVQLGSLQLGDLPPGHWRHLTAEEVHHLRREAEL